MTSNAGSGRRSGNGPVGVSGPTKSLWLRLLALSAVASGGALLLAGVAALLIEGMPSAVSCLFGGALVMAFFAISLLVGHFAGRNNPSGAIGLFVARSAEYRSLGRQRYDAGKAGGPGTPVHLLPGRWRIAGRLGPGGTVDLRVTAELRNTGAEPVRRAVFQINPELTVHLHREAVGEWICLDAQTRISTGGAGLATSVLSDLGGQVGVGAQSLLVNPR